MHDIAEFLSSHEPFSGLDEAVLDRIAERVEVEFFAAGTIIIGQGEQAQDRIRVVRRGAVELVDRSRVIDLLGEGEMFGHPSMLSGMPTGFEVRAAEDVLTYVLAAEDVLPLLARPEGLRFLGRSILDRPRPVALSPVELQEFEIEAQTAAALIGEQPVIAEPGTAVREAVQRMESDGASSVMVPLNGGGFGIVTDRDLRSNLIAAGRPAEVPLEEVMTAPARCVGPEQSGAELMLLMLDHGIHHVPVVSARSEVLGVVRDIDLLAAETRTPFMLRKAIDGATQGKQLGVVVEQLKLTFVTLHQAGVAARQISLITSVVLDALFRRTIELAIERVGAPPAEFTWLALGSDGRREAVPSSDVDSGMAWRDESSADPEQTRAYMRSIAEQVSGSLKLTGLPLDAHGVTGDSDFSCSSISEWRRAIRHWLTHPEDNKVLIATSILLDGRAVFGPEELDPKDEFYEAGDRDTLLRWMLRLALAAKPPTGFMRDMVLEHSGEHRGTLDIKHGGLLPIVDIARYAGLKAKSKTTSTIERLRAASDGGVLEETHARTLAEAFDLFMELRVEHQVSQLRAGRGARRPPGSQGAQLADAPLPARRVPGGHGGAEKAGRGAPVAADQLTSAGSPSATARAYGETSMPDPSMRWSEVSFVALDFETTGLDPSRDEIISFATVPVESGRVRLADSRYSLVRPERMPGGDSIRIHGLRPADLEGAPSLYEVLDELLAAITGRVLIAHIAAVERGFLSAALKRRGLELRNPIVDTAALAAELDRRTGRFAAGGVPTGLSALTRAFRLPVHRPHHADGDALTTAQVFLALATHLDRTEPLTLGAMQELRHVKPERSLGARLRRAGRDLIRSSARP